MLEAVTTALGTVLEWIGTVVDALVTSEGALYSLLPLFAVGVSISALLVGVKICRSIIWGA